MLPSGIVSSLEPSEESLAMLRYSLERRERFNPSASNSDARRRTGALFCRRGARYITSRHSFVSNTLTFGDNHHTADLLEDRRNRHGPARLRCVDSPKGHAASQDDRDAHLWRADTNSLRWLPRAAVRTAHTGFFCCKADAHKGHPARATCRGATKT